MVILRPSWLNQWGKLWTNDMFPHNLQIEDVVLQRKDLLPDIESLSAFSRVSIHLGTIHLDEEVVEIEGVFNGRHTSHFAGIPPTQRPIQLPFTLTCSLQDQVITQASLDYDAQTLLQQLGLL